MASPHSIGQNLNCFPHENNKQIDYVIMYKEFTEDELHYREIRRRKSEASAKLTEYIRYHIEGKKLHANRIFEVGKEIEQIGKPPMMWANLSDDFVEEKRDKDKETLTWEQLADVCDEWTVR